MSDNLPGLKERLVYHRAPPTLAARILDLLPEQEVATPALPRQRRRWWPVGWSAGSGLAGALVGACLVLLLQAPRGVSAVQALIDHHAAAMVSDRLIDVQTSNEHVVKPWLSAHLGISPPIEDLAAQGFPLIGGRADVVEGRPTAVAVYRHDQHIIDLFAWASPGQASEAPHEFRSQGFTVIRWRSDGLTLSAVSDVEADQLRQFADLVRSEGGGR